MRQSVRLQWPLGAHLAGSLHDSLLLHWPATTVHMLDVRIRTLHYLKVVNDLIDCGRDLPISGSSQKACLA